jgi:hypothetical protein
VRAAGLEPTQGLRPYGFSYQLRLSPSHTREVRDCEFVVWTILHRGVRPGEAFAVGAARLVSTPSRETFVLRAWLGTATCEGSPTLRSSASPVSRRAPKSRLSPLRLPILPPPRTVESYRLCAGFDQAPPTSKRASTLRPSMCASEDRCRYPRRAWSQGPCAAICALARAILAI